MVILLSKQFPSQIHKIHNQANLISQGVLVLRTCSSPVHYCASSIVSVLKQKRPSIFSGNHMKKETRHIRLIISCVNVGKEHEMEVL